MKEELKNLEKIVDELKEKILTLKENNTEEIEEVKNVEEDITCKRPRYNNYWFIDTIGIGYYEDKSDEVDNSCYSIGNYFETKEQAENYKEKLIIEQELRDIARELNKGEEIDWNNKEQDKYFLYFDYLCNKNKIDYTQNCYSKIQGAIYCLDENFKDIAVERIGEERLTQYLKGQLD